MATDIAGLFGLTPQMYEQGIRQSAMNEGAAYARMAPEDRAIAGIYSAGAGLGRVGGGLMGVEDPQMKLISARQQIINQVDQTNPESMLKGAQTLANMGDQQGAFALADYARKAQSELALAQQRIAEKMTPEQRNAMAFASSVAEKGTPQYNQAYQQTLSQLISKEKPELTSPEMKNAKALALLEGPEGSPAYNTKYASELARLTDRTKADKTPIKIGVADKTREVVFYDPTNNEQFVISTGSDGKQIRKPYTGAVDTKTIDIRLPNQPVEPKDWMAFDQNVLSKDPTMQRTSTILSDAPSAIDIIRSSTTNDISAATLPGALARLTGEGKNMSNADVNRFARTGGLDDRLAQDAVKFFTGRTTDVKKDQAEKFAIALYRGALLERKKKLEDSAEQYGYTDSPNYKVALRQIDTQLGQFKLVKKGETTSSTTQSDDDLIKKYNPNAGK